MARQNPAGKQKRLFLGVLGFLANRCWSRWCPIRFLIPHFLFLTMKRMLDALPPTDGVSIVPTLLSKHQPPRQYLYWEFCLKNNWGHAVRMDEWKAVSFAVSQVWILYPHPQVRNRYLTSSKPLQLFNISADIHEDNDVSTKYPIVIQAIQKIATSAHVDDPNWPVTECGGEIEEEDIE